MSNLPQFSIKTLLEAGVHFGHRTMRWNPKMAPFIYGAKNGIHILDLQKTVPLMHHALNAVYEVIKNNGRVLFVGTKKQASEVIARHAKKCGQYYVNHRWLGGMLTNWGTVSKSISRMVEIEKILEDKQYQEEKGLTKKELLDLEKKHHKLELSLGGIREMGGKPDLIFVIDTNVEDIAIKEAARLGIPVVAVIDSNSDPRGVHYPIPGNDDASRSIEIYCELMSETILAAIEASLGQSGVDLGEAVDVAQKAFEKTANDISNKVAKKTEKMTKDVVKETKKVIKKTVKAAKEVKDQVEQNKES